MTAKIGGITFTSGDLISCYINSTFIENGRIEILSRGSAFSHGKAYICHNNSAEDGERFDKTYGYRYTWAFTFEANSSLIRGGELRNLVKIPFEPKENVRVESQILNFLELNDIPVHIFYYQLGVFNEYDNYHLSDDPEMIKLSSSSKNKKVEIKLGRLMRQFISAYNEKSDTKFEINDAWVESIHNKWVSFRNGTNLNIEFLKGQDILMGYNSANYFTGNNTLHKSCMTNKFNYLSLYTENPNQVELAIIKNNDKIIARALVWTTIEGKRLLDRSYFVYDWLNDYINKKCVELGIGLMSDECLGIVQLEKHDFKEYPYVDSFYNFDKATGRLIYFGANKNLRRLRNTNGTID